jgi:hypothetical protein
MSPMVRRSTLQLSLAAAFLLISAVARAGDPAAAQALFDEGKFLVRQGRYAEACPKLEESQKLDPGLGTKFQLANCWQQLGRTASAWALFREVEAESHALAQGRRERVARDRAVALVPWLSKIAISPHGASGATDFLVRRDGVEVGREQWDTPLPVDPGTHVVTAIAPNKQPWQTTVEVPADGKIMTVDIPPLADVPDVSAPALVSRRAAPIARPPSASSRPPTGVTSPMPASVGETGFIDDRGSGQRSVGWIFVGAGVVGLAAGTYFTSQWIDERGLSNAHCLGGSCDSLGARLRDDAHSQGIAGEATLAGAAGAFLLGAVLVATAPRPRLVITAASSSPPTLRITPMLGPGAAGLDLQSSF